MGQKTNPIGIRLGIIKGWDSNWYGGKDFSNKLVEDDKIRKYLNARLAKAGISKISLKERLNWLPLLFILPALVLLLEKVDRKLISSKKSLKNLPVKKFRSIFLKLKDLNWMHILWLPTLLIKLKEGFHSVERLKQLLLPL